jgi:hypothetical protein
VGAGGSTSPKSPPAKKNNEGLLKPFFDVYRLWGNVDLSNVTNLTGEHICGSHLTVDTTKGKKYTKLTIMTGEGRELKWAKNKKYDTMAWISMRTHNENWTGRGKVKAVR